MSALRRLSPGPFFLRRAALAPMAALLLGACGAEPILPGPPEAPSLATVLVEVPGNTVVKDGAEDLQLRPCSTAFPHRPCSLPPGAPVASPEWTDLARAKITQVGKRGVDLSMVLQAPIPATPPFFVAYGIQFENGCTGAAGPPAGPTDKEAAVVAWNPVAGKWEARWRVITNCNPRTVVNGPAIRFKIEGNTIRMRVPLPELLARAGEPVEWFARVNRMPFVHEVFTFTIPVDAAPDVAVLNPSPPPPLLSPDEPAVWRPHP